MKNVLIGVALAAATAFASPANAVLLQFTVTGDYNASFQVDSDPAPDFANAGYFALYDVVGTFEGAVSDITDLRFYIDAADGGFTVDDYVGGVFLYAFDGPQLFTGTTATPTFRTGTFALTATGGSAASTLTIAAAGGAVVPEPAAWGLMTLGFGLVGAAARRRRPMAAVTA